MGSRSDVIQASPEPADPVFAAEHETEVVLGGIFSRYSGILRQAEGAPSSRFCGPVRVPGAPEMSPACVGGIANFWQLRKASQSLLAELVPSAPRLAAKTTPQRLLSVRLGRKFKIYCGRSL